MRAEIGAEECLSLCVTDTGIGIADEDLELVLKPFRQVDNSLSRKYEGVGLGLPLTHMLVEIHGGELRIVSKLNEGTEVTVIFPGDIVINDIENDEALGEESTRDAQIDAPTDPAEAVRGKKRAAAGN